jgi:hypothetical protein
MPSFPYVASGNLSIGGSSSVTSSQWAYQASGSLSIGGNSGVVSSRWSYSASGGLSVGGNAICKITFQYTATGTLNDCKCNVQFEYKSSGTTNLNGSANIVIAPQWRYTASGSLALGGSSRFACSSWRYTASGGLSLGGSAGVKSSRWAYTASGGLNLKGEPDYFDCYCFTSLYIGESAIYKILFQYTAVGCLNDNKCRCNDQFSYESSGTVNLNGSANIVIAPQWRYTASGSLALGGSSRFACSSWSYTASGGLGLGGSAGVKSSRWAYTASGGLHLGGTSNYVNHNNVVCADCSSTNCFLIEMPSRRFRYVASGGLGLGGSAGVKSSRWSYAASGGLSLGGSLPNVVSSNWSYRASGRLSLGGRCEFAAPTWSYTASGSLTLKSDDNYIRLYRKECYPCSFVLEGAADVSWAPVVDCHCTVKGCCPCPHAPPGCGGTLHIVVTQSVGLGLVSDKLLVFEQVIDFTNPGKVMFL